MRSHEAMFWERLPEGRVHCTLCPHDCRIADGRRGACGVRVNEGGVLYTLVYDRVVSRHVEPIEKKPLFHFRPGTTAYSIATVGCNLRCAFCQNWQISQWPREHLPRTRDTATAAAGEEPICPQLADLEDAIPGEHVTPASIVAAAAASGAASIAYTFTEPTIFYELAYDTAVLAREQGLGNVFVTNGFTSEAPLRQLATVLDAANVDLKFFTERGYRHVARAGLQPVLDAIRLYHELGVWIEVTTLVIPGVNDSDEELRGIATFLRSVGPEVPWHLSRFFPAWRMLDTPPTPVETLERAARIGREAGLRYIYVGNVPGEGGEDTACWSCGAPLIRRFGFVVLENRIRESRCPDCGATIDGLGMDPGPPEGGGRGVRTPVAIPQPVHT